MLKILMTVFKKVKEINNNLGFKFLVVFYRNFKVWLRFYKPSIVGDILEPLLFLAALGIGIGKFIHQINGVPYIEYIVPGIISSSSMYAASFEGTFGSYTRMVTKKVFDAILATPVSIEEIVVGEIIWGSAKAFMSGIVVLLVALIFGWIISPLAILIPIVIFLNGLMFSSLSLLITSFSPSYDFFSYYFTIAISTMFLFSGVFYPVSSLPPFIKYIVYIMPLYYTVDLMRLLDEGRMLPKSFLDLGAIAVFSLVFFYLSVIFIKKRLIS
jgi:lipooligosaccharide transport system permease protein